ncbi:MAG: aspartate carbamoyltransferase catalytic subunit [Thermoleophilia bacterium]|nr:aspartate carbamoyltransferase catalytic subunit [Thermoleophilia bacterium]
MHLISIDDLSYSDIQRLFELSDSFLEISSRSIKKVPSLRGRTLINVFLEPSTRTQTSFELAGKRLSADVINIKGSSSSVVKGESFKDTILTLDSYRPDVVVLRHPLVGAARMATRYTRASVINAGDGSGEHPTQCLLDLYSLRRVFGNLEGLRVAIVGDVLRSRVARSNVFGFRKMGIDVRLVGPRTLMPPGIEHWGVPVYEDLDALSEVDVVYLLRMQLERAKGKVSPVPSLREYSRVWGVSQYRLKPGQRVMHPGPVNRGVELSGDLVDDERALILHQVESGLAMRMAILYQCLAGELGEEALA